MTEENTTEQTTAVAQAEIKSFVERIERLEEEKKTISDDIKDVYGESKGRGYDTKVLKQVVARRKLAREELAEMDAILDLYEQAMSEAA